MPLMVEPFHSNQDREILEGLHVQCTLCMPWLTLQISLQIIKICRKL